MKCFAIFDIDVLDVANSIRHERGTIVDDKIRSDLRWGACYETGRYDVVFSAVEKRYVSLVFYSILYFYKFYFFYKQFAFASR